MLLYLRGPLKPSCSRNDTNAMILWILLPGVAKWHLLTSFVWNWTGPTVHSYSHCNSKLTFSKSNCTFSSYSHNYPDWLPCLAMYQIITLFCRSLTVEGYSCFVSRNVCKYRNVPRSKCKDRNPLLLPFLFLLSAIVIVFQWLTAENLYYFAPDN